MAQEHIRAIEALTQLLSPIDDLDEAAGKQPQVAEATSRYDASLTELEEYLQNGSNPSDVAQIDRRFGSELETAQRQLNVEIDRLKRDAELMETTFGSDASSRLYTGPGKSGARPPTNRIALRQDAAPESVSRDSNPPAIPSKPGPEDVLQIQKSGDSKQLTEVLKAISEDIQADETSKWEGLFHGLFAHPDANVQAVALELLVKLKVATSAELAAGLKKSSKAVRLAALKGVGDGKLIEHIPSVVELLKFKDSRDAAVRCLESFGDQPSSVEKAIHAIFDARTLRDPDLTQAVCEVLGACGTNESRQFLVDIRKTDERNAESVQDAYDRIRERKDRVAADDATSKKGKE